MPAHIALLLVLACSCTGDAPAPATPVAEAPSGSADEPSTAAPAAADAATAAPDMTDGTRELAEARTPPHNASGWGAVFWRDGQAGLVGEGSMLFGPQMAPVPANPGAAGGPCGGARLADAPEGAVLAGPAADPLPTMSEPSAVQAALVETLAWRIDEVLPPRDRFTPAEASAAPNEQRGVEVGSAIKVRRAQAPPIMLSVGVRDCTGAVVVARIDGSERQDAITIPNACQRLKLLPPTDLDGDGNLETMAWNDDRATLIRLADDGRSVRLEPLADWTCPTKP